MFTNVLVELRTGFQLGAVESVCLKSSQPPMQSSQARLSSLHESGLQETVQLYSIFLFRTSCYEI